MKKSFGSYVNSWRKIKQLTLRETASILNVSASTLSRVERGLIPDTRSFLILCGAIGFNPMYFFSEFVTNQTKRKVGT